MRFRKRVFILLLTVSVVSTIYLLTLLPQKEHSVRVAGQFRHFPLNKMPEKMLSPTRQHQTTAPQNQKPEPADPVMNVIAAPQLPTDSIGLNTIRKNLVETNASKAGEHREKESVNIDGGLLKNKTFELGVRVQNKSLSIGEKLKNKTLEHLGVMGVAADSKRLSQLVFVPRRWNLTVSFEDIGDIMKETQFLNKVDPLNLDGPILVSSLNRTANFTYKMALQFGYCDCFERYCVCCTRLTNKRLHLNTTACSNFTFVSKTHELDLRFFMDGKLIHKALISADKSPMLCLGSEPKVADVCVHLFNMTFRVNEHNHAQTQLLGCTDLSLNLYNRTIGAFPVDCFQIPGDPNKAHRERSGNGFNMGFNWMP